MDPRRLRSRQKLQNGLLSLFDQKPLDQISIEEIAATSGVSRPTFYSNYNDSSEIVKELIDQNFSSYKEELDTKFALDENSSEEDLRLYFSRLFELISADKKLLSIAFSGRAGCDALSVVHEHVLQFLPSTVLKGEVFSNANPQHVYASFGFCGIVKFLCESKFPLSPEALANEVVALTM